LLDPPPVSPDPPSEQATSASAMVTDQPKIDFPRLLMASPLGRVLRRVSEKAREVDGVHAEKTAIQRRSHSEVKPREIIRTVMCVGTGFRVTDEKILISTKRSRFGRHLAYVSRNSQKNADAIVMSHWLIKRRASLGPRVLPTGVAST
jgi:hypothetical protein